MQKKYISFMETKSKRFEEGNLQETEHTDPTEFE